jgi:hypothetical protein
MWWIWLPKLPSTSRMPELIPPEVAEPPLNQVLPDPWDLLQLHHLRGGVEDDRLRNGGKPVAACREAEGLGPGTGVERDPAAVHRVRLFDCRPKAALILQRAPVQ